MQHIPSKAWQKRVKLRGVASQNLGCRDNLKCPSSEFFRFGLTYTRTGGDNKRPSHRTSKQRTLVLSVGLLVL